MLTTHADLSTTASLVQDPDPLQIESHKALIADRNSKRIELAIQGNFKMDFWSIWGLFKLRKWLRRDIIIYSAVSTQQTRNINPANMKIIYNNT